ncbi:hypothetical protein PF010_g26957, partial [Phytophthora fragariae]
AWSLHLQSYRYLPSKPTAKAYRQRVGSPGSSDGLMQSTIGGDVSCVEYVVPPTHSVRVPVLTGPPPF